VVHDGVSIVLTGDLETAGWTELLKNATFRSYLAMTRIFVASHHGRTSGYCPEVFNFCKPDIIIISDKEIVHQTQEQDYSSHASGVSWNSGTEKRYVLTTRSDGKITLTKSLGEGFRITPPNQSRGLRETVAPFLWVCDRIVINIFRVHFAGDFGRLASPRGKPVTRKGQRVSPFARK